MTGDGRVDGMINVASTWVLEARMHETVEICSEIIQDRLLTATCNNDPS